MGGGAADRLAGLEWRYIKELFESAAGKVQRTSMRSFSWNLGLAKIVSKQTWHWIFAAQERESCSCRMKKLPLV